MNEFSAFYEKFYQVPCACRTTVDELRNVVQVYKAFRLHKGLMDVLEDADREASYIARMKRHIEVCEFAERIGDTEQADCHHAAFLEVWKDWVIEICGDQEMEVEPFFMEPAPKPNGFWARIRQMVYRF